MPKGNKLWIENYKGNKLKTIVDSAAGENFGKLEPLVQENAYFHGNLIPFLWDIESAYFPYLYSKISYFPYFPYFLSKTSLFPLFQQTPGGGIHLISKTPYFPY